MVLAVHLFAPILRIPLVCLKFKTPESVPRAGYNRCYQLFFFCVAKSLTRYWQQKDLDWFCSSKPVTGKENTGWFKQNPPKIVSTTNAACSSNSNVTYLVFSIIPP